MARDADVSIEMKFEPGTVEKILALTEELRRLSDRMDALMQLDAFIRRADADRSAGMGGA